MSSPIVEPSTSEQTDQLEYESDVEADLEVDQLDSDTDAETEANASKKKSPSGERIPGSSLLPAMRLENIIQAEGMSICLAKHSPSTSIQESLETLRYQGKASSFFQSRRYVFLPLHFASYSS